jgi:hypothetical protein
MNDEQYRFLTALGQSPARLTTDQVAWFLNCQPHDVPVLVAGRLLKPLGNPPLNGIKFFDTADLIKRAKEPNWLGRVTCAINLHWHKQNARKKCYSLNGTVNDQGSTPKLRVSTVG